MKINGSNTIRHLVLVGFLLIFFGSYQTVHAETEVINSFNERIAIQKDGSLFVTENIVYNFGANQKHGIFRDIPLAAANGPQLRISVLGVKDAFGNSYQYTRSITNNVLRIKIGNPNIFISGVKTYSISYQVYGAIRQLSDHNELYWNVTGNQWPVAMQSASASVVFPDPAISDVRMDCFTGPQGSTQKNCAFHQDGVNVNYATTQPLNANEGLTLVLGMPLGYTQTIYVSPPRSSGERLGYILIPAVLLVFFFIFIFVAVKLLVPRLTKPRPIIAKELKGQPVVVAYSPPDHLPPIEVGTLLDRRVDITDISSVIIDLAVRGYIKIRYTVQHIRFWPDKKDFELIKRKDGSDLIHPADKIIFKFLFSGRNSVKFSDLKKQDTAFQSKIKKIQEDTGQHLRDEGYFNQAAKGKIQKLKTFLSIAFAAVFIGIFISGILPGASAAIGTIFLMLFGGAAIVFSIIFSVKSARRASMLSPRGIATLAKILGFREFLQLTEKDKLQLLNAPKLQPEMFEKFLPYAMVLGVDDKWAKKFEGMYNTIPDWYEDPTATRFNSYVLARNLTLFNASFNHVFSITSPQSSSGFGGGGFSGGGSGGGGGGSW